MIEILRGVSFEQLIKKGLKKELLRQLETATLFSKRLILLYTTTYQRA